jgi:hypothetical protein
LEARKWLKEDEAQPVAEALGVHPCELQRFPAQFRGCAEALADIDETDLGE